MRLFVFNCLLLASLAIASPNDHQKRDLAYLKNLISSDFFVRSQINIKPEPVLQEEVGYNLFRLPGYEDVMIKVTPKKPIVEEFVYPPVEKVNLKTFGSVVGTKTKDDTRKAVKEVNNLLSSGILYGGHNNAMKETIVPMFPSINTGKYVVEERIKTAPRYEKESFESRPIYEEVIETKPDPVFTEVFENRPIFKEVTGSRPVYEKVIETRPRPIVTEVFENRPAYTEVFENRPVIKEVIESRPVFEEVIKTGPRQVLTDVIKSGPVLTEVIESRPKPVLTEVFETRLTPALSEVIESRPVLTEVVEEKVDLKGPFEPTYSYKQMKNNEAVMTYTGHTNPGVELLENIEVKTELPMCVKKRVDEAIVLGADPTRFTQHQVFQFQSPPAFEFSYPKVEENSYVQDSFGGEVLTEEFRSQNPPVFEFSYPNVEEKSKVQDSFRGEVLTEEFRYQYPPVFEFSYPNIEENLYVQGSYPGEVLTEEVRYQNPPVFEFSYPKLEENSNIQHSFRGEVLTEEFQSQNPLVFEFSYPKVEENLYVQGSYPGEVLTEEYRYQNPPVFEFSYPKVEENSYVQGSYPGEVLTEEVRYQNPPVFEFSYPKLEENSNVQDSFRGEVLTEEFQSQNPPVFEFSYPKVEENLYVQGSYPGEVLTEQYRYQNPAVFEFSYPKVEENSYVQGSYPREILTEESESFSGYGWVPQRFTPSFQDKPVRYNLRPTKTKAHKHLHFEEDISTTNDKISASKDSANDNSQTKKVQVFSNSGEQVDIAQTLGPIPSQYITNVNNKSENAAASIDKTKQMKEQVKAVQIVSSKDNVSNEKIPSSVYRLQFNPNTGKSLKENSVLRTNVKPTINPSTMAPVITAEKDNAQERNIVYTNKVTAKPQTIKSPVKIDSIYVPKISTLREFIESSAINKQIVAQEARSYTYRQKNADGSSLNVNGNKHGVSVDVKNNRGRGDIPDQ